MSPKHNGDIPVQLPVPWGTSFAISWQGLKRRFLRSLITVAGVILAIAFLSYMLTTDGITDSLIRANDSKLNVLLQQAGVDVLRGAGETDSMMVLLLGLSLLTCLAGILNAMLMSVTERIREIGTLKCLGARDGFIVKVYFIESSLQGICGSLIGMVVGCLVALAVATSNYGGYVFQFFPALTVFKALGLSFLAGSFLSVMAAIGPAYLAARKQPVEALRVEE